MFNCLCINDLFALQRYKNFWTFLLFPLCFKALSTIYLQVGNFSSLYSNKKSNGVSVSPLLFPLGKICIVDSGMLLAVKNHRRCS